MAECRHSGDGRYLSFIVKDRERSVTEPLDQVMEQLRLALTNPQSLDEKALESLRQLADDIERVLIKTGGEDSQAGSATDGISERLQGWIEHLEADHPEWTNTLSLIAERLADMGI